MVVYSNLPYDVIHEICLAAKIGRLGHKEWEERQDKNQLSPRSLLNLSLVNRQTRDISVPIIFQSGTIIAREGRSNKTEEEINDLIEVLMKNDLILRLVK